MLFLPENPEILIAGDTMHTAVESLPGFDHTMIGPEEHPFALYVFYLFATLDVFSGVPQGSVLGALLFLLYINDLSTIVKPPVKMKLYADDCLIYMPVSCTDDQLELNKCLEDLELWCCEWDMQINLKKQHMYTLPTRKMFSIFSTTSGATTSVKRPILNT